jgi:hypothetical protein
MNGIEDEVKLGGSVDSLDGGLVISGCLDTPLTISGRTAN